MGLDLMMHYHRRTDHGRDGADLDGVLCNCRQLFEDYARELLKQGNRSEPWAHPNTMIGRR